MTLAEVVEAVMRLPEMVGEPNEGGRSLVRRTDVLDILAIYAYAQATAELVALDPTDAIDRWRRARQEQ